MNRQQLIVASVGLMKQLEKPLARAVVKEKNRYIREAGTTYLLTNRLSATAFDEHTANIRAILDGATQVTVMRFGKLTARRMKCGCEFMERKVDGQTISDQVFNNLARYWMGRYGAAKVADIAATTRNDLRRALLSGEDEGDTAQQIRSRIQAAAQLSYYRASTIARTETHNAAMFATAGVAEQIAQETGAQLTKEWLAVEDERTREDHSAADGQKVDMGGVFNVGGEALAYPGDPMGSAANVINCRCVQSVNEV
jgi:uncharacterized protein with gpF-like domain